MATATGLPVATDSSGRGHSTMTALPSIMTHDALDSVDGTANVASDDLGELLEHGWLYAVPCASPPAVHDSRYDCTLGKGRNPWAGMERQRDDEGISKTASGVVARAPHCEASSNTDSFTMVSPSLPACACRSMLGASSAEGDSTFWPGLATEAAAVAVSTAGVVLRGWPNGGPPGKAGHAVWQVGQQYCRSWVGLLSSSRESSSKTLGPAASRTVSRS